MARPTKHEVRYRNTGRPTVVTPDMLLKLEDAFRNAFSDEMACLYAGISEAALYSYCKKNPDFAKRKELLKKSPNLTAQVRLVKDADTVPGARWWAEHRMPEFMPKSKVEIGNLDIEDMTERSPEEIEAARLFREARRRRIEASSDSME